MNGRKRTLKSVMAMTLAILVLASLLTLPAGAANVSRTGLNVERLTFRDVLRLYSMDKSAFGENAEELDSTGTSNGARALAAMFTYTVGLNYTGEGQNYNYYGKDITAKMGESPYVNENIVGTYDVEISPYHGYAVALAPGHTTEMTVYRVGYNNTVSGVESIFHYVWEENGTTYAVKDDGSFYKVSYNGKNAVKAAEKGAYLFRAQSTGAGTAQVGEWKGLFDASADTAVQLSDGTLLAADGCAMLFGMADRADSLSEVTGLSDRLNAVSNFVEGGTTYATGPLIYTMDIYKADTMEMVESGENLECGTKYLFHLVYDEGMTVPAGTAWGEETVTVKADGVDDTAGISDFVWYGAEQYLTDLAYNPDLVEFCYTPSAGACGVAEFSITNLVGYSSALSAAPVFACLPAKPAPTPAPTPVSTAVPTAAPTPVAVEEAAAEAPAAPAEETAPVEAVITEAPVTEIPEQSEVLPTEAPAAEALPEPVPEPVFDPTPLTRAEAAVLLWEYSGRPEIGQMHPFLDLPEDSYVATAISWAAQQGYILGYGDGSFGVDDAFSREQCAVILARVALKDGSRAAVMGTVSSCDDANAVSVWARDSVDWAVQNGYYKVENNCLRPGETATKGDFELMLRSMKADVA